MRSLIRANDQSDKKVTSAQAGISRRELIRNLAFASVGLLSTNVLAGDPVMARELGGPVRKGQVLSESQMRLLRELVDIIIPQSETPGAAATDTHGFIDDQLAHCQAPEQAGQFIAELDQLADLVRKHWGADFPDLSPEDKHAAMSAFAFHDSPFGALSEDFFYKLKELTVIGYYSSQAGASQELVYLPVPGGYLGDFKVSANGGKSFSPPVF